MNLGDPELELIDPTPNVHTLFIHFDKMFFWTKLASRVVVKWSKRMYSCAGVCSYEGRGGLCNIALSEPLLKLRPRKDLVETLLHEMIHAFLFITNRDRDRDGHGPMFQSHMHRINKCAGLKISIYHSFHDEVELYQTHWWRCNGPCQARRPHFGIVRKPINRAPGPSDYWWECHKRNCGGTFIKIKEPEKKEKKTKSKPSADITKYITSQKTVNNNVPNVKTTKPILKDSNSIPVKSGIKSNSSSTMVVTQKGNMTNPSEKRPPPILFSGKGQAINATKRRSSSGDVVATVRSVWANKQLSSTTMDNKSIIEKDKKPLTNIGIIRSNSVVNTNKNKSKSVQVESPAKKIKKIDDYFQNASKILKDIYGQDFDVSLGPDKKLVATASGKKELVDCPICSAKVNDGEINKHLDECLNKDVIEDLCKDKEVNLINHQPISSGNADIKNLKDIVDDLPTNPTFKATPELIKIDDEIFEIDDDDVIMLNTGMDKTDKPTDINTAAVIYSDDGNKVISVVKNINYSKQVRKSDNFVVLKEKNDMSSGMVKTEKHQDSNSPTSFDSSDGNKVKSIVTNINYNKRVRKSDNFVIPKEQSNSIDFGYPPPFLDDMAIKTETPPIKIEPGTSKDIVSTLKGQKCACCGKSVDKPIEQHLDECLAFFDNNTTIPEEGASTSFANEVIVIDDEDDDRFDESQIFNATGTKNPCPCCLEMIEEADMRDHLDRCLS